MEQLVMCFDEPERWLPVVGYEGRYEVSDLGNVRSLWQMGAEVAAADAEAATTCSAGGRSW